MIYEQNTIPIPCIPDTRPTFAQFRTRYGLSQHAIATQASVHVLFVYCLEKGSRIEFSYALSLLHVLSKHAGRPVRFEEICDIHLKNSMLIYMAFHMNRKQKGRH